MVPFLKELFSEAELGTKPSWQSGQHCSIGQALPVSLSLKEWKRKAPLSGLSPSTLDLPLTSMAPALHPYASWLCRLLAAARCPPARGWGVLSCPWPSCRPGRGAVGRGCLLWVSPALQIITRLRSRGPLDFVP